ncbi:MAG: chromosome segregation protein SMC [Acidobacteria bacterium]|nr:MAG: chromosome segregation protein SMC [Acidobacteriota bacterium]
MPPGPAPPWDLSPREPSGTPCCPCPTSSSTGSADRAMLRLEKLELAGFKSFPERTVIEFPPGVTAVVGPNGCGKSNIADAVQWVLGEQSARALRGRRMEDVIFAGSQGRGPGGMAEVSLHLVARKGNGLPDGRERVVLTRRLYRSGESEYLIDGRPARLQDIRDLLEQIRAGARTYAITDQARVAAFVLSKPKERRLFIEEAAGISGYKQRRRLAENKLEATRSNLLRVDDILREVERQRRSLKRQASLARRARKLDEQLRSLRGVWYRRRGEELARRLEAQEADLAVARREEAHLERERARLAEALALGRATLDEARAKRDRAVERAHAEELAAAGIERELEQARGRLAALEARAGERDGSERRLAEELQRCSAERERLLVTAEALAAERNELSERCAAAERSARDRQQELERARERAAAAEASWYEALHERADLAAQLTAAREAAEREAEREREAREGTSALEASLEAARRSLEEASRALAEAERRERAAADELERRREAEEEAVRRLEEARAAERAAAGELAACAGEKSALDTLEVRLAGEEPAARLLERSREARVKARGVVADALSVDPEAERAAEAHLDGLLPAVVVEGVADVLRAAELPVEGRVRLLPLDLPAVRRAPLPPLAGDARVRGRLAESIAGRGAHGHEIAERIDEAYLVTDLRAALELYRAFPGHAFVTPEGHRIDPRGVVTVEGNGQIGREGLLARHRRREELGRRLEVLEKEVSAARRAVSSALAARDAALAERRSAEERLRRAREAAGEARVAVARAQETLARFERELEIARSAQQQAASRLAGLRARGAELDRELERVEAAIAAAREEVDAAREGVRLAEQRAREAVQEAAALAAERGALDERRAALERDRRRVEAELARLKELDERGRHEKSRAREEACRLRERAERLASRLEEARRRGREAAASAERAGAEIERLDAKVREVERRHDLACAEFETVRGRRERLALEVERSRLALQHERENCVEELGCDIAALPEVRPEGFDDEVLESPALLRETIADLRRKRERVGAVNPLAEEEYDELSRRYEELSAQHDDLEQSIRELEASIRRMNRESRERFMEAFREIRAHFKRQFALLFQGGNADLVLDEEDNPLEAGIEILCQPPGKKLQSVTLLSGGEKALAATAILFAIFSYQPPPFCLLDEVDAPLDDANVGRFADAVKSFTDRTQFILMTHNKRSMEMADVLYGVTMPEPGVSSLVALSLD